MSSLTVLVVGLGLRASVSGQQQAAAPAGVVDLGADASTAALATPTQRPAARRTPAAHATTAAPVRPSTPEPAATHAPVVRTTPPAPKPTAARTVTVNGGAADTRYGPVQVQIKIRAGRIISSDAIDYPQDSSRDREINSWAIPELNQETLDAQSAEIDTVSGATYTSEGYRESLQSAIDAAHQAGLL
jgi:uncharacterized protein with FMN-binding domain